MVKKTIIYMSPLRALSTEKYLEWSQREFKNYKIVQLTGDTLIDLEVRKRLMKACETADIVLMTSELLDLLTRNFASEKYNWLLNVVLIICDESHTISMKGRGANIEISLMRFSAINNNAKIWFLSATLPNVNDFKKWGTLLNSKETVVVNSSWRPTRLVWKLIPYINTNNYFENQYTRIVKTIQLIKEKPNEKFIVFVWDKATGRLIEDRLNELKINCKFHNADVDFDTRTSIIDEFETSKDFNVIIATTTLAYGCNTSAKNVIIVGTRRGLEEVDVLDILQAGGRAGRFGKAPIGTCYFICDNPQQWQEKIKNQRIVTSVLLDTNTLVFHICAEIKNKTIYDHSSLHNWYNKTLASLQGPLSDELVDGVINTLKNCNCIEIIKNGQYQILPLGVIASSFYFHPEDVYHWYTSLHKLNKLNLWHNDLAVAYSLANPTGQLHYIPKTEQEVASTLQRSLTPIWKSNVKKSLLFVDLYNNFCEENTSNHFTAYKKDFNRIASVLERICSIYRIYTPNDYFNLLKNRVIFGCTDDLSTLCKLPGINPYKAKRLHQIGIKTLQDILDNPRRISRFVGSSQVPAIVNEAKRLING